MNLEKLKLSCKKRLRSLYNFFVDLRKPKTVRMTELPALNRIKQDSLRRTALNEHLETLFVESLTLNPRLIVELGVARGESTRVFAQVAQLCGAKLVGVDIRDCSGALDWQEWLFIHRDDLEFAREFEDWCRQQGLTPRIDVLFIDTSHYFEHTLAEIRAYFPFLADHAKVFFHDTNLKSFIFRKDGSLDLGWDNHRGVIRALEVYFGRTFPEKEEFLDCVPPWLIKHYPHCSGLTVLEKLAHIFPLPTVDRPL
ncbi:MAG: class I SAM-dependent methyltransferase [Desulfobaccales bacterium]